MKLLQTNNGYKLGNFEVNGLTPRESEAILWLANGGNYAEISQHMRTSVSAAKARIQNIAHKLRLHSCKNTVVIAGALSSGKLRLTLALLAALHAGISAPALIATDTDLNRVARVRSLRQPRREFV